MSRGYLSPSLDDSATLSPPGRSGQPPVKLEPGTVLGRYVLDRLLGEGGNGAVYAAHDTLLDRPVALKVLHPSAHQPRRELLREAQAAARLAHPNVITVHDVGADQGVVFLSMEFVKGRTLRAWQRDTRPSVSALVEMYAGAGRGLAAAHAAGVVHRDFKPDNVLVGEDGRPRVLDFGIAHARSEKTDGGEGIGFAHTLNEAPERAIVGTPLYMAPEQWSGEEVDARGDQFAFCVALWEALFSSLPFDAHSVATLAYGITTGTIRPPPEGHGIEPSFERVLRRGLSVAPEARYPNMAALLDELRRAVRAAEEPRSPGGRRYQRVAGEEAGGAIPGALRAIDRLSGRGVLLLRPDVGADSPAGDRPSRRLDGVQRLLERGSLRHPHLVAVTDVGVDPEGRPYFAVDLPWDAPSFRALADAPPATQLARVAEVLEALAFLHGVGRCHGALDADRVRLVDDRARLVDLDAGAQNSAPADVAAAKRRDLTDLVAAVCAMHGASDGPLEERVDVLPFDPPVRAALARVALPASAEGAVLDARALLGALAAATAGKFGSESAASRESRLRQAPLVGRDDAVETLRQQVARGGAGAGTCLLIGGEAGVGKSRLLEETRAFALATGMLFARGAASADNRGPYAVWREPLRLLAVSADPTVEELATLQFVVPDLPALTGRNVPNESRRSHDAQDVGVRIAESVLSMLDRLPQPVFLAVEDLQWAGEESLALFARLADAAPHRGLALVGTWRSDEAPGLADRITAADVLPLRRLARPAVAALCEWVAGPGATAAPALVDGLMRETEGNPALAVETLRALAEENPTALPAELPAGLGAALVQRVLARKLRRLSASTRELLELAAAAGRTLDPPVLAHASGRSDVPAVLEESAALGILDADGAAWRFSHDRLRDALLAGASPSAVAALHGRIAGALEAVHGLAGPSSAAQAAHWAAAGDRAREIRAAWEAARVAEVAGAPQGAVALLDRCLPREGDEPSALVHGASEVHDLRAHCYLLAGLPKAGQEAALASLEAAGASPPRTVGARVHRLVAEAATHVLGLARPGRSSTLRAPVATVVHAWDCLAVGALFLNDPLLLLTASLAGVNAGRRGGSPSHLGAAALGLVASMLGFHRYAAQRFEETQHSDHPAVPLIRLSYRLGLGDLDRFTATLDAFHDAAVRDGAALAEGYAAYFRSMERWFRGDVSGTLEQALATRRRRLEFGAAWHASFVHLELLALGALGRREDVRTRVAEAASSDAASAGDASMATLEGACAFALAEVGDVDAALDHARRAWSLARSPRRLASTMSAAVFGPLEACIVAWEQCLAGKRADLQQVRPMARLLIRAARTFASRFVLSRSPYLLAAGRVAWFEGRHGEASKLWEQSLDAARRDGLGAFHLARVLDQLGRTEPDPARRRERLHAAASEYARAGAQTRAARALRAAG